MKKAKATKEQSKAANDLLQGVKDAEIPSEQLEVPSEQFPQAEPETEPEAEPDPAPEPPPAPIADGLRFGRLSGEVDRYRTEFFRFDADGTTIDCKFVQLLAPGQREGLTFAAIEVERYPEGDPVLLPANTQLWEAFSNLMEAGGHDIFGDGTIVPLDKMVFRITRTRAVPGDKPGTPPKFVRFSIRPALAP